MKEAGHDGSSSSRRNLLLLLGTVALAYVPYRYFFTSRVPVARDLLFYFYPLKAHLAEALRAVQVPWIDRYRWGGMPLLGSPSAAPFDPGNLLFLFLPLGAAMKAWILLHLAVSVAGFASFARKCGVPAGAARVSGLVYALGGVSVSLAPFPPTFSALSMLPWFASFTLDVRDRPTRRSLSRLSVATALLALASSPEFAIYAGVVFVIVFASSESATAPGPLWKRWGAAFAAGALGLCLAGPGVMPALATAVNSDRGPGGGTGLDFASGGALPVKRLLDLLCDGLLVDWAVAARAEGVPAYPFLPSITPGRVALILGLAGLLTRGTGRLRAAILIASGILLALGPATPVWLTLARVFPPLSIVRFPEKHLVLAGFGFAWLAALGLGEVARRLRPAVGGPVLALVALAVVVDRESIARSLSAMQPGAVLTRRPELLSGLPPVGATDPPPRLFQQDSYIPRPIYDLDDLSACLRAGRESVTPEYGSLFGAAYFFERDYDISLTREAVEWTRLFAVAGRSGSALPQFLRSAGVTAIVASEPGPDGKFAPKLSLLSRRFPPYRFASRIVADPDANRLLGTFLGEGFDPMTAYLQTDAGKASGALPKGRVLEVNDLASELRLVVEADGPGESFLVLYRLKDCLEEARVDGRPAEVVETTFGFGGVRIAPGRHVVQLRPDTSSVKIGLLMTLLSVVALAVVARHRPGRDV